MKPRLGHLPRDAASRTVPVVSDDRWPSRGFMPRTRRRRRLIWMTLVARVRPRSP
jgi:hypothetical protein